MNKYKEIMTIFCLFIVILYPLQLFSQVDGIYKLHNEHNNITNNLCYDTWLTLFNDGHYLIESIPTNDIELYMSYFLSFGEYNQKGSNIYLFDELYDFKLVLQKEEKSLFVSKGMPFLDERKFKYELDYIEFSKQDYNYIKELNLKDFFNNQLTKYLNSGKQKEDIQHGNYIVNKSGIFNDKMNCNYKLSLSKNTYILSLGSNIISRGRWEQSESLLTFHDNLLNYKFYMIVKNEDCIISNGAPGLYTKDKIILSNPE
jgi:hypothetical protein